MNAIAGENEQPKKNAFRNELLSAAAFPLLFTLVIWLIEIAAELTGHRMVKLGIHPHSADGLLGILTSPLIHGDLDHILSNTGPLLIVGTGIIYFYKELAYKVFGLVWLMTGFWVWAFAEENWHIGASGLIYGLVCFLFFSGVLRKDTRLLAVSMLVTFLYGSLVWGILPINQAVSWESHLFGSIAGIFCAVYFRKEGPQKPKPQWLIDEETGVDEEEQKSDEMPVNVAKPEQPIQINYEYIQKPKENNETKVGEN
jgi:membrane associated rhomboid family serine protease